MMEKSEIEKRVQEIFLDQFESEKWDGNKKWAEYNFSSIQLIYFLKDLEAEFGPIALADFYDLKSGADLSNFLYQRLSK